MFGNIRDPFGHDLSNFNGHDILGAMEDVYWAGDCADSESSNEYGGGPVNRFGSDASKSAKKSGSAKKSAKKSAKVSTGIKSVNLVRLNRVSLVDVDTGELVDCVFSEGCFEFRGLHFIGVNVDKLILRCDVVGCRLPESSRYVYLPLKDILWIEDISADGYVNLNVGLRKSTSVNQYVYRLRSGVGQYFEILEF